MHLQSEIVVPQDIEQVNEFFYEPSSLAKWDRSVKEMIPTGNETNEPTFDTIAPSGMKMSYKVIELVYGKSCKIELLGSKMFKNAIWEFVFDAVEKGTRITCHITYKLRPLYYFLAPVLYFTRGALLRDLKFLRDALDKNYSV